MKRKTSLAFSRLVFEIEIRAAYNVGTCSCGRPKDQLLTPIIRQRLDELIEVVAEESDSFEDEDKGGKK